MIHYKGHDISDGTPAHLPQGGIITEIIYSVRKDGKLVHDGIVRGQFNGLGEARRAVKKDGRAWVDQRVQ
jgi:hypothetical protein